MYIIVISSPDNTQRRPSQAPSTRGALPPTPDSKSEKPSEKKIFVAIYGFNPTEEGDLELIQVMN